jgi:hypothetical protein
MQIRKLITKIRNWIYTPPTRMRTDAVDPHSGMYRVAIETNGIVKYDKRIWGAKLPCIQAIDKMRIKPKTNGFDVKYYVVKRSYDNGDNAWVPVTNYIYPPDSTKIEFLTVEDFKL